MDLAKHCQLCQHQKRDLHTGTKCGLTNEKPYFNSRCHNIKFNDKLADQIEEVNVELETVRFTKSAAIFHASVFGFIGIAIITAGYLIGEFIWEAGFISTVPLIIVFAGLGLIPFAVAPLNKYRNLLSISKRRKEEMDELLNGYKIKYRSNIKVTKDIHGNLDVHSNTELIP